MRGPSRRTSDVMPRFYRASAREEPRASAFRGRTLGTRATVGPPMPSSRPSPRGRGRGTLCHRPRLAAVEEGAEIAGAALRTGGFDLVVQLDVVLGGVHVTEDADRFGKFRMAHAAQQISQRRFRRFLVVEEQVVWIDAFAQLDDLRL